MGRYTNIRSTISGSGYYSGQVVYNSSRSYDSFDIGKLIVHGNDSYTNYLPTAASYTPGATLTIQNSGTGGAITITAAGTDKIDGAVNQVASVSLLYGDSAIFTCDGKTNWIMQKNSPTGGTGGTLAGSPGEIAYFATSIPPAGFLEANGAVISRTAYNELFSAIGITYGAGNGSTTFALPDLRGEFIRGLDSGRGVDAGRALGSAQTDMFKSHAHDYDNMQGNGVANSVSDNIATTSDTITPTGYVTGLTGGIETRPRNIALLVCIRYSMSIGVITQLIPTKLSQLTNDIGASPALVSGTTIKTVGGTTVLGSGDIPFPTSLPASDVYQWAKMALAPVSLANGGGYWYDMIPNYAPNRMANGTRYFNTYNIPIMLYINCSLDTGAQRLYVNAFNSGNGLYHFSSNTTPPFVNMTATVSVVIPSGWSYEVNTSLGTATVNTWLELR
jgi:microcystin-dependent protein